MLKSRHGDVPEVCVEITVYKMYDSCIYILFYSYRKLDIYFILQLTEVGELGRRGGLVQRPVAVEDDPAHEFATTQNRLMAG